MNRSSSRPLRHLLSLASTVLSVAITAVVMPSPVSAQTTWVVDADGHATASDCHAGPAALTSIQDAVNAAAAGDTIFVCPGTYDEQVVVTTSNLTIRGASTASTVLQPTAVAQNTVRPGTTSPVAPIVLIDGATGVTVANLTIDGGATDSGNAVFPSCGGIPFYTGIYYRVSSGTVDAARVTNIKSTSACTFGVLVQTDQTGAGGVANVVVRNNLVDHYGIAGVNCIGQNTTCTVTGNTIRGEGPADDLLQIGIVIRAEATSTISGNVITDHFFLPGHGVPQSAVGIFLFFASPRSNPHVVQQNVFADNQVNVQRIGTAAAFD